VLIYHNSKKQKFKEWLSDIFSTFAAATNNLFYEKTFPFHTGNGGTAVVRNNQRVDNIYTGS
jgi:hypothetical protein